MRTPAERLNGLQWRLRATRRLWNAGVEPQMPFLPPQPMDQALYQGQIDNPSPQPERNAGAGEHESRVAAIDGETLTVQGWATFRSGPCARVEVWLDAEPLGRARLGVPRPDVAESFDEPYVEVSGFELSIAMQPLLVDGRREGRVRVVATGPRGEANELPPVRVRLTEPEASPASTEPPVPIKPARLGGTGRRVLVVTHQLTLGGAQLYLTDLLGGLRAIGGIDPVVVSSTDGPLREDLEADGIPVHVTELVSNGKLPSHLGRVEEFVAWARPFDFELVLVNTATSSTFPGGEIADALGIPSVWAIHESFEPALLWADLQPTVRAHAEEVIGGAAFAVFEADATRRIYESLIEPARCVTLPYGLDLTAIDGLRADFDAAAARRRAGVPADARLVVCIGTVEPRKAQISLAAAFDLVGEKHPDTQLAFVGGRDDPNTRALEVSIETSPRRQQMAVIPVTPDVADWYGMADLLVCASDVESLPRTVLEAMAWETPVLATSVFGLPELIDDGETGWLCEPRDVGALAATLDRALSAPAATYDRIAQDARALVEKRHAMQRYAEEVSGLFETAIKDTPDKRRGEDGQQ